MKHGGVCKTKCGAIKNVRVEIFGSQSISLFLKKLHFLFQLKYKKVVFKNTSYFWDILEMFNSGV